MGGGCSDGGRSSCDVRVIHRVRVTQTRGGNRDQGHTGSVLLAGTGDIGSPSRPRRNFQLNLQLGWRWGRVEIVVSLRQPGVDAAPYEPDVVLMSGKWNRAEEERTRWKKSSQSSIKVRESDE
jgi:hypothetical protein